MGSIQKAPHQYLLLLITTLLGLLSSSACAQQATAAAAHVRNSRDLYEALTSNSSNSSQVIVLHADVELGPDFDEFAISPLLINRNVTITSVVGNTSNVDAMPVIDLMHKPGIIELCSSCWFTFKWVSIAHENQVGTGLGMSVFRGQPGSRLERIGGVGLRTACPPTAPTLFLLNNTQRSPLFPGPPGGQQLAGMVNYTHRGRPYKDMLSIIDLSAHIPVQQLTDTAFMGGYSIRRRNATRLCDHIVSAQCLQRKLPEECIAELLAHNSGHDAAAPPDSPTHMVAIVVPVVLAGLLMIATVAGVLLWRKRRQRQQTLTLQSAGKDGAAAAEPSSRAHHLDLEAAGDQEGSPPNSKVSRSNSLTKRQASNSSSVLTQPAAAFGPVGPWQLLWSSSAPSMTWTPAHDSIELGVLLGAGAFGRVYRGKWAGLEVAVKVIQHDTYSAKDVANEVQLMLALNHPNIVRAYHCMTKQLLAEQPPAGVSLPEQLTTEAAGGLAVREQSAGSAAGQPSLGHVWSLSGRSSAASQLPTHQQQQQQSQQHEISFAPVASSSGALHSSNSGSGHIQDLDVKLPLAHDSQQHRQQQQQHEPTPQPAMPDSGSNAGAADTSPQDSSAQLLAKVTASSETCFSSSAASKASTVSSLAWPLIPASGVLLEGATAAEGVVASDSAAAPGIEAAGDVSGSGRGSALVADRPGALCETWLVQELCDRGTLARQASELQPEANEQDMLRLLHLLRDVACGLTLLKAQHVVHADLNAHNVLVASSFVSPYGMVAKVADLGLSRVLKQHATHRTTRTVGMLSHQPPELLRDGRMSPAVDIYSFGVMMYEVYTRQVAYPRLGYGQIYNQVVVLGLRPAPPADMPEDYVLLMKSCWSAEASERPSVDMLLECLDLMIEDRREPQQRQQQQQQQQ